MVDKYIEISSKKQWLKMMNGEGAVQSWPSAEKQNIHRCGTALLSG